MKKYRIMRGVLITLAIIIVIVMAIVSVFYFPLKGKDHLEIWSAGQPFDKSKITTVEKTRDDFKILVFSDPQLWHETGKNDACLKEMDELVKRTKPDLITVTGDVTSGHASRFAIDKFISRMESYKIPWGIVFGNHDDEFEANSKNWLADKYANAKYSLFQKGPSNLYGSGNYVINVVEKGEPVYSIFMFDNGKYIDYGDGKNDEIYMGYEQIAWYEWNVLGMQKAYGRTIPSMTFSHFPQPEFKELIDKYGVKQADGTVVIPKEYGGGYCREEPCVAPVKSGFYDKCKELGSTKYIFSGHDHANTAWINDGDITMAYGLKTGPSPTPWNDAIEMGGTLITITGNAFNPSVEFEHIVITRR